MAYSISVGVFDWVNFPKQQGFYPDDIPEDWKLAYYSNEFKTACLSLAALESQFELLEEWLDDLPVDFELGLFIQNSAQIPIVQALLQNKDCTISSLIVENSADNNLLHKENVQTVISTEIEIYQFADLWTPQTVAANTGRYALLPATGQVRQYREWIEQWLNNSELGSDIEQKTLWLPGADISYQQLTEIRTLTELMGY